MGELKFSELFQAKTIKGRRKKKKKKKINKF